MNYNNLNFLIPFLFLICFGNRCQSQSATTRSIDFKLEKTFEPYTISLERLHSAQTLKDLDTNYKPSWVKEYYSLEIVTKQDGKVKKAKSDSDNLTEEQIELMSKSDLGSNIYVSLHYLPDNSLKNKEDKFYDIKLKIGASKDAEFIGGQNALSEYIQLNTVNRIPANVFDDSILAVVTFNIDESGQVINAHLAESSENESTNKILLEAICNMPSWKPAEYENGTHLIQEFVFLIGNLKSCKVNFYNFRPVK